MQSEEATTETLGRKKSKKKWRSGKLWKSLVPGFFKRPKEQKASKEVNRELPTAISTEPEKEEENNGDTKIRK